MNKNELIAKASRSFNKLGFEIKKHSPEILIAAGVVGTVATTVMACKATLKVNAVLDETKANLDKIHEATETGVTLAGESYSVEDAKKDTTAVYAQTGLAFVKLYGPAVVLGTLSIGAMITSHRILSKRNVALASAYAAVDKSFKEYRGRVVERFGEDLDRELRYNIKAKEIEEKVVNEDGTEETVKKTVEVANPDYSDFARVYDDGCSGWTKDPEHNKLFLQSQQRYANERLARRGVVSLNEVYDMLGIPRSKEGMIAGWIYDENAPVGEQQIDFGIFNTNIEKNRDFINGYERTIILDFNCRRNVMSDI